MAVSEGEVSFADPAIEANTYDPTNKTLRFEPVMGKVYQITFEKPGAVMRKRHYGRRYAPTNENPQQLDARDIAAGAVVLPHPESGVSAVFRPVEEKAAKERWGYRRCTSHLGFCPGCVTGKTKLEREDKGRVDVSKEAYGCNIIEWIVDDKGNLLDKFTKRPVEAQGPYIKLDRTGTWDQRSYLDGEERGEPDGIVRFWQFNSKVAVQVKAILNESMMGGPFPNLNVKVALTDKQFKEFTLTAMLHVASAANYYQPKLLEMFKASGIKNIAAFICKDITPRDMVFFYGLEPHLLKQCDQAAPAAAPAPDLSDRGPPAETPPPAQRQAVSAPVSRPAPTPVSRPAPTAAAPAATAPVVAPVNRSVPTPVTTNVPVGARAVAPPPAPIPVVPLDQVAGVLDEL